MASVTAVVPTWNQAALVAQVVRALKRQSAPPGRILVVDDGSTDGAGEAARSLGAETIRFDENRGFAAAVNAGIRAVETPWVAIVNNDVELAADWLDRLCARMQEPDVWFAAGKLLKAANPALLDGAFDLPCRGGLAWRAGWGMLDGEKWNQPRRIRSAPLTAVLLRRELFDRVGLLDEAFGSYLEDVDFGIRCALRGFGGVYEPGAVAWHRGSATLGEWSAQVVRLLARNQVLLAAKYRTRGAVWPTLVGQALWTLMAFRHGAGWSCLRGKWEGLSLCRRIPVETAASEGLARLFEACEGEIREIQSGRAGLFWRLYFALT